MYKKSLYGILVRYSKNVEICFVKIDIGNKFMNRILEERKLNKKKVCDSSVNLTINYFYANLLYTQKEGREVE